MCLYVVEIYMMAKVGLYDGLKCLEKTCFEQKIVAVEEMAFASN